MNNGTPVETYQDLNYQNYDEVGNIKTLVDSKNSITHAYEYDPLNRLTLAKGNDGVAYNQTYTYDRIGNIKSKSDVENGSEYIYTYGNKPHAVRSVGNITLQYNDANGNMTQRVANGITLDFTYTYDNKPDLIKKNSVDYIKFTYDGNGSRVKKYNYSTLQTALYFGESYEERGGVGFLHLFSGSQRVASVLTDGRTQFYHTNHLGSASFITDQNGDKKEQIEYYPFGAYRAVGSPTGTIDYDATFPDVFYTFTGQEDDDDLGLYNYKARLYDPVLGRFISPDRLVPDPGDPQALNRYSYCQNNPLIYVDPSGESFFGIDILIIAIVAGAALGAASAAIQGGNAGDILKGALIGGAAAGVGFFAGAEIGLPISQALGVTDKVVQGIIQGAVGGIAGSATSSALSGGGYIGRDILIGAISGGIGGGLGGAFAGSDPAVRLFLKMGSGALIGGAAAELTGGKFAQGAIIGAASGAISSAVEQYAIDQEKYSNTMPGLRDKIWDLLPEDVQKALMSPEGFRWLSQTEYAELITKIESSAKGLKFGNLWIDFKRSLDVTALVGGAWESKIGQIHLRGYQTYLYVGWDKWDIVTDFFGHMREIWRPE